MRKLLLEVFEFPPVFVLARMFLLRFYLIEEVAFKVNIQVLEIHEEKNRRGGLKHHVAWY